MPKVSKKRRFRGQSRWDVDTSNSNSSNLSSPRVSTPVVETASVRKVRSQSNERSKDFDGAHSYRLIELSNLVGAFQHLHNCQSGGELKVSEDEARRYGISCVINVKCSKCDVKIELQTSGNNSQVWKSQNAMDTNRRMVYSAMEMGVGREAMSFMCDIFNMPPPWNRAPKHRYKGAHVVEIAVMSAVMSFNAGAATRQDVMKAANIPGGHFTFEGCSAKDNTRMADSVKQAAAKEKERRRKRRQAKLAANEGECSYASGMFNDVDPLDFDPPSSSDDDVDEDDFDEEDDYPLSRFVCNESDDSDDAPLSKFASRRQEK